ncbi:hypothetical protein HDU67_009117 [Dinochytrium kinnereticum]|nr:hypothetical protein HDU67_009117 [Dinochytrium kinnereticum]
MATLLSPTYLQRPPTLPSVISPTSADATASITTKTDAASGKAAVTPDKPGSEPSSSTSASNALSSDQRSSSGRISLSSLLTAESVPTSLLDLMNQKDASCASEDEQDEEESTEDREIDGPMSPVAGSGTIIQSRIVLGSLISSCFVIKDPHEKLGMFFIFPDIAIRASGTYRLRFDLFDLSMGERGSRERDASGTQGSADLKVGGHGKVVIESSGLGGNDILVPVSETSSSSLASIVSEEFTVYREFQ